MSLQTNDHACIKHSHSAILTEYDRNDSQIRVSINSVGSWKKFSVSFKLGYLEYMCVNSSDRPFLMFNYHTDSNFINLYRAFFMKDYGTHDVCYTLPKHVPYGNSNGFQYCHFWFLLWVGPISSVVNKKSLTERTHVLITTLFQGKLFWNKT